MSESVNELLESPEFANNMQRFSELFDDICQKRWEAGAEEYGDFTFLGNDIIRMMIEELADTANYARMQVIKLLALNEMVSEELKDTEAAKTLGFDSFKGSGLGWKAE